MRCEELPRDKIHRKGRFKVTSGVRTAEETWGLSHSASLRSLCSVDAALQKLHLIIYARKLRLSVSSSVLVRLSACAPIHKLATAKGSEVLASGKDRKDWELGDWVGLWPK
ncbi:unnamed protein product [Cuscuta campestris]|uniref:Uncharacterized protein n=1 Tax=Cuscuta campestris TaxID=132261 RepID=A0A484K3M9_9ASTE|nr:unnamed protein product [Cuscuta campestris]